MAKTKTKKATASDEVLITKDEVFNVLAFANQLYNGGGYPNVYSPELVSNRMRDATLTPQLATIDKINTALSNPKESEEELIGYSQ